MYRHNFYIDSELRRFDPFYNVGIFYKKHHIS